MNFLTIVLALASCVFFMPVSEPPKALHENTIDLLISILVIFSRALKSFLTKSFSRFLSNLNTASATGLKLFRFFSLLVIDCLYIYLMTKPWMRLAIWSYRAILSFRSIMILRLKSMFLQTLTIKAIMIHMRVLFLTSLSMRSFSLPFVLIIFSITNLFDCCTLNWYSAQSCLNLRSLSYFVLFFFWIFFCSCS